MAEHSKSRIRAEAAFLRTQTKPPAGNPVLTHTETINEARDANTARLKEQRLNKEALERAAASSQPDALKNTKPT